MIGLVLTLLAGPSLVADTRYHLVKEGGKDWLRGPSGKFFSFGVCCVEPGPSAKDYRADNTSYASFRYYTSPKDWAKDTTQRLTSWHFNTIGAWSGYKELLEAKQPGLVCTPILHIGSSAGAPWVDMWDRKTTDLMDKVAAGQIDALKGQRDRIVGYFSDNEQGWWNGALFDWAWKSAGHRKLVLRVLKAKYPTWQKLLKDFEPVGASSLQGLSAKGRLYLRPGGSGIQSIHTYVGKLADRYYSLCRGIIKKHDPGALYLGDRFISNFYPEVAAQAGRYCDVVSTNLNADWNDGTFTPFYLPGLHRIAKKPLMITEYYMSAKENRSGNKNDSSGFPVVVTQRERAGGFAKQTQTLLDIPYVVGAHWFQYNDEPQNGRGDGENYNFGLVDTSNRPYEELIDAEKALNFSRTGKPAMKETKAVPRRPNELGGLCLTQSSGDPRGDAFATWRPDMLNLTLYWYEDRFNEALYKSGKVPAIDEPEADVLISIGGKRFRGVCRFEGGVMKMLAERHPEGASGPDPSPLPSSPGEGKGSRRLKIAGWGCLSATDATLSPTVPPSERGTISGTDPSALPLSPGEGRDSRKAHPLQALRSGYYLVKGVRNTGTFILSASEALHRELKSGERAQFDITLKTRARAYTMHWKGDYVLK